ncbi:hypothetical protein G3I40_07800, partial [Streptomyces sp. SID14478]|nr:hypothetical protein [Streptomyces sp. SID14478]
MPGTTPSAPQPHQQVSRRTALGLGLGAAATLALPAQSASAAPAVGGARLA